MKSWSEKLMLAVPFILWAFCFWNFFAQRLPLFADATSYADHIRFYTDNLSKGVFPLWDPTWFYGAPNEFFLRRMGDVNPFFSLIILLKWAGVPSATAYLVFIGLYYFLAAWALYLIARLLWADRFWAFSAYVLFLFSSWGSEIFYNYIIIIFVPIIWSFYFLLSFGRKPQKSSLLGLSLCLGLIVTTYIPFFFLIILSVFAFFFVLFYGRDLIGFFKKGLAFFEQHKIFSLLCVAFFLISCIPGLAFYKASKSGGFVLPGRHFGTKASSQVSVGTQAIASGDLVSHGYFDRLFDDQAQLDMGDIYIPYLFFLVLLLAIPARTSKLIFFLLFNILMLFLITITSASRINAFLYGHLVFLKFIRQVYYLFWLGMLPMAILLAVAAFKSLTASISASSQKKAWLAFIVAVHLAFIGFLLTRQGVLAGAWVAVALSLLYFIIHIRWGSRVSWLAALCLLLPAVFIQSAQVYAKMEKKLFAGIREEIEYQGADVSRKPAKMELYYATHWFSVLVNFMDPAVLDAYLKHRFIFYDNVFPYEVNEPFFKTFNATAAVNGNAAYVPRFETVPGDWQSNPSATARADVDPLRSGRLSLAHADADTWSLKARLPYRQFLVINDNYDTGWHAFINGRPARLLRANVAFKGLWLPAGESKVRLRFSNPWNYLFRWALVIIYDGLFLLLLVFITREKLCPE